MRHFRTRSWAYLSVVLALGAQSSKDVSEWIKLLKNGDPEFRVMGAKELARLGPEAVAAVPDLIAVLGDRRAGEFTGAIVNRSVRDFAASALVSIGRKALPALQDALRTNPDKEVRLGATMTMIVFLEEGKDDKVINDALSRATADRSPEVRRYAAEGLGLIGPAARIALSRLTELLKADPSEWVRREAIIASQRIDREGDQVIPLLAIALRDQNPDVRGTAAAALGRYGARSQPAVPALTEALKDRRDRHAALAPDFIGLHPVRCDAAEALGRIGPSATAALPMLRRLLTEDRNPEVRVVAALAVWRISPKDKDSLPAILHVLGNAGGGEDARGTAGRDAALEAIREMGPDGRAAIPILIRLLGHELPSVRTGSAEALGAIGDESTIPKLMGALKDEHEEVRAAAARGIERIRERER